MRALVTLALVASGVGLMSSAAVASDPSGGVAAPAKLSLGGVSDPIGIDDLTPDLQWRNGAGVARQTAYQVRVASTRSRLGDPDLWDSGRVRSAAMATSYAGDRLGSRDKASWQVRVWDAAGRASEWSRPASFEMGLLDEWVQRDDGVSYGKFLAAGATSLPESWTSSGASQNHYMLGAIDSWFTGGVAGITQADDSVAWKKVVIEPALVGDVESAASSYESVRGTISSSWVRTDGQVRLTATIPPNTTATVRVPAAEGVRVTTPTGARRVASRVPGFAEFEVGTGTYTFITR
ncbi:alpha-L-rhamnosidase C-terminal domain-containing protein [Nocardioides sp. NPDC058538]|uniref:glycoside hydrolase family 78 protein n=1 Tax=Nocardioides sp. NPDC058538 TaxID=3346542 RepID=UPI0036585E19